MSSLFERMNRYWGENRPRVVWGTLIGLLCLAFLVGAWFAYDALASPPKPDLQTASAGQLAEFVGHARGWRKMSISQRKQWLLDLVRSRADGPQREALARAFRRLSKPEKRVFVEGFMDVVKPEVLADARAFAKTPRRKRNDFLKSKMAAYNGLARGMHVGGGTQDLASPFGEALPDKSSDWTSLVVQKTSATERAVMKPYIDQLTDYAKFVKEQRGSRQSSGRSAN